MAEIFIFLLLFLSSIKSNFSKPGVLNYDLLPKVHENFNMSSHLDYLHIKKVCSSRYSICKSNDTKVCGIRYFLNEEQFEDFDNSCFMFLSNMCDTPGDEYYIVSSGNCRDYFFENLKNKRKARRDDDQEVNEETTDQNEGVTNPEQESEANAEAAENDENDKGNPDQEAPEAQPDEGNEADNPEVENVEAAEQEITEAEPTEANQADNGGENIEVADQKDIEEENKEVADKEEEDEVENPEEENTEAPKDEENITENLGEVEGNTEPTEQSGADEEPAANANEEATEKPNGEENNDNNINNDITTQVDYAFIEATEDTDTGSAITTPGGKIKYLRAKPATEPRKNPTTTPKKKPGRATRSRKKRNATKSIKPAAGNTSSTKPTRKRNNRPNTTSSRKKRNATKSKKPAAGKTSSTKSTRKRNNRPNTTKAKTTAKKVTKPTKKKTTRFTLYSIDTAFDDHICPMSCPTTYSPVCVSANRGYGVYFKFYTFINHCLGDLYYCQHWKEFSPPPDEDEMVISSPLSWSFCGASRYIQFARFAEVASSMGHYGWLAGDYRPTHIMEPHERIPGYG